MAIAGNSNGELERKLWETAEKLRGPVDPSEYKDYTLGLLFLKKMSEAFEERREELEEKTRNPNSDYYVEDEDEREYILTDKDEYTRENVFYIPEEARWQYLVNNATDPQIGQKIDEAMRAVEEENPRLKGMLPKDYSRSTLPHDSLEGLINLFADLEMSEEDENGDKKEDQDIFGRVYEFFIKKFAMEGGQKGGEFYTPKSVVELLVEILEPYEGRIFDPFCGSGGMFVQSHKFLQNHGGDTDQISIYGQEIKESTWRICKMNLYLRGLDGNIKLGDSIRDDQHRGLEADYVITNPPFNMEEWGRDAIAEDDPRFKYGLPPEGNGNFAFIQHMIHHLAEGGLVGTVMANGSLSSDEEADLRKEIIEDDLLDAVIALPNRLFYTTEIPVALLILSKGKGEYNENHRNRKGETLFVDAREYYKEVGRTSKTLTKDHIEQISETVRSYRGEDSAPEYNDERGYCKAVDRNEISDHEYIITPGRYVGIPESIGEYEDAEAKTASLTKKLKEEFERSEKLQEQIEIALEEVEH
jgi:type I restriction enzyme M protein